MLIEKYSSLIWQICAQRLNNPEDIRECVNSTFADFCTAYERFDPQKGSLQNYLCTIADRRAMERYRKICAVNRAEEEYRNLTKYTNQLSILPGGLELEDLNSALDQMDEADAQLLRMRYCNGMSFAEIARHFNLPYETVKKRGQRSLNRLKRSLNRVGGTQ